MGCFGFWRFLIGFLGRGGLGFWRFPGGSI